MFNSRLYFVSKLSTRFSSTSDDIDLLLCPSSNFSEHVSVTFLLRFLLFDKLEYSSSSRSFSSGEAPF
jgi:hypothetical protein